MSNNTASNPLRAALVSIDSCYRRAAEFEVAFDVIIEQRAAHTKSLPAIRDGLKTHGKAMYAALSAGNIDIAEREGNEYMKWTMQEKKYDRMLQTLNQNMQEQLENIDKIHEELKPLFCDLATVTSHGDSTHDNYADDCLFND